MWRNDTKCKYMFMFPLKHLARKGLRQSYNCLSANKATPDLYSLSNKTSYHEILWNLEAMKCGFSVVRSLWNLTGVSHIPGLHNQHCVWGYSVPYRTFVGELQRKCWLFCHNWPTYIFNERNDFSKWVFHVKSTIRNDRTVPLSQNSSYLAKSW